VDMKRIITIETRDLEKSMENVELVDINSI
jgi:hypothetical protein